MFEESLVFDHRPEVERLIFISTPHRGSLLASNWIGRPVARLIQTPRFVLETLNAVLTANPAFLRFERIPNSIETLSPTNRFLVVMNRIPITRGIPYHSIIGDRGRGNTPNSSDGVVDYSSSHLPGAQSERIVPSAHSAEFNPEAIAEVRRILKASR